MDDVKLLDLTSLGWERVRSKKNDSQTSRPLRPNVKVFEGNSTTGAIDDTSFGTEVKQDLVKSLPQLLQRRPAAAVNIDVDRNKPHRKHPKVKIKAWAENNGDNIFSEINDSSRLPPQRESRQVRKPKQIPRRLQSINDSLSYQQEKTTRDENITRLQLMQKGDQYMHDLPLNYLYARPELHRYALERCMVIFQKLVVARRRNMMRRGFSYWMDPPVIKLDDRQIGFLVIAKALSLLLEGKMKKVFRHWAMLYSLRYNHARKNILTDAAIQIQRWWKQKRHLTVVGYRRMTDAIQVCLHRRRAMKHFMRFEVVRRQALIKIIKGIVHRRRVYFAARSIQRIWRWVLLYSKMKFKLIRAVNVRRIQRWRRMILFRPEKELSLIRLIIRCGGYTRVRRRMTPQHLERGMLNGINACVTMLQRAWFTSRGKLELFMRAAARRAKMEYEKMLNDKATIIQNSYRAHLWDLLLLAAKQNNRARRVQRGFRAYQYRKWVSIAVQMGRHRRARKLQRLFRHFLWICRMQFRWKYHSLRFKNIERRRQRASIKIQREYRAHVVREQIRREEIRKAYEALRASSDVALAKISMIQRNWRQFKKPDSFPKHVKMVCMRIVRKRRAQQFLAARRIQRLVQWYIVELIEKREKRRVSAASSIWRLAKAYLLRLAIYDRIIATRERRRIAANIIKENLRPAMFVRKLAPRLAIRRARIVLEKYRNNAAAFIQEFYTRKVSDYFSAVRVASRFQLDKRLKREEEERIFNLRDKAARRLIKFFKMVRKWNRFHKKMVKLRRFLLEKRSVRRIVKFFRFVLAWKRFNIAAAERRRQKEIDAQNKIYGKAAGVIGFFYRRYKENKQLRDRFVLRRRMLDEVARLVELRRLADVDKQLALDEVTRSEANMKSTIAGAWKQGSDPSGKNYYYNYVTGESRWTPPDDWKVKNVDTWVRNKDERDNIYYYNMLTGESRWLPPCCVCGEEASRWCMDCGVAYCEADYDDRHGPETEDEDMRTHTWSATEFEKEILKPGEVYCVECTRRAAKLMCTTCWDPYCDQCFKYIHHVGMLKSHKSMNYKKAKAGWICIRARDADEQDYYVNGTTGDTTFEKPEELMTEQEKMYYENFKTHKKAAEDQTKTVEKLQFDLEAAKYERDTILFDALNGTGKVGEMVKNKFGKKKSKLRGDDDDDDDGDGTKKRKGGGLLGDLFGGKKKEKEYREVIMNPSDRARNKSRNEFVTGAITSAKNPVPKSS